jgi:hypothetical protein
MNRVSRDHYDDRDPIRSTYEVGLRNVFAACHDPLPAKMEELLHRLRDRDDDTAENG